MEPSGFQRPQETLRNQSNGQVAQLVEHWTENPGVGGSIPPLSTGTATILARAIFTENVIRLARRLLAQVSS